MNSFLLSKTWFVLTQYLVFATYQCVSDGQTKSNNSCTYGANIASRGACGNGEDRGGGSRKEKRRGPPTSANYSYIRPRAPSAGPPAGSPTVASKV